MELLFWVLGLFLKPFVVLVFLFVMVVMLDLAASVEKKENLERKKNGVEEAKLAEKGRGRKVGAVRKSKKKKRVKFMDDVEVRKANDAEVSDKPGKDFKLYENVDEKVGSSGNLSEGRLVVERGEGSKIMEDAGDVVVRKVYQCEASDKPIQVFELSDDMSKQVGFSDWSLEERLDLASYEGSNIVNEVHQFEAGGVDKASEVLICGDISAEECGDVNAIKDSKGAGAGGEESKIIGLLDGALDGGVADERNEVTIIGDYCGVKGEDVMSGLECSVVEQEINIDAVGGEDGLTSMNDNVRVEECHAAAGERMGNTTEFLEEEFETKALDGDNGLKFINDDALESEDLDGKNGMVFMNDAVVTESNTKVEKKVPNGGEVQEEKSDREAVDSENGDMKMINGVVQIDESDAESGERVDGKAKLLEEDLEREVVEERSEDTAGDLDKVYGGEECSIRLGPSGLENLAVEEVIKSEESCSQSKVELVSDSVAYPQIEVGRVGSDNVDGKTGMEEGFTGVKEVEKGIVGDQDVVSKVDNDYDDDWEGVESSELEKAFAEAVNYVEYGRNTKDDELRSDVQMLLYGLHKLAVEGPCHVPQPMAFKVSSRAKWNAWQNLGSMSPETAMEEYIKVLSDADPGWTQLSSAEDGRHVSLETNVESDTDTKLTSLKDQERKLEDCSYLQLLDFF